MNLQAPRQLYYVACCVFPSSEREADGEIYFYFQGELEYELEENDRIVFISTLHGG